MPKVSTPVLIMAAFMAVGLAAGCSDQQTAGTSPFPPVPPPIFEVQPKPPVTAEPLQWQPGHWDWTGGGYVWAKGRYVPADGHGPLWMPGWWDHSETGWVWQPPHWTS